MSLDQWELEEYETNESHYPYKTVRYFEVKVVLGGLYDQIAVGVTTDSLYPLDEFAGYKENSIAYHADDGKCYINGEALPFYGPKYGSCDSVGCGVTENGDIYYSINGMILPLINLELEGDIYPIISLRGKYTSVSVDWFE